MMQIYRGAHDIGNKKTFFFLQTGCRCIPHTKFLVDDDDYPKAVKHEKRLKYVQVGRWDRIGPNVWVK